MTTVASVLFGGPEAGRESLDAGLGPAGLDLGRFRLSGVAIDPTQVSVALLRLLDMSLGNVAMEAWHKYAEVARAKRRTAAEPGSRQVVELGEHTVTSIHTPTVHATLGAAAITLLRLKLEMEITVSSLTLLVEHGRVVDSRPGRARASLTLSGEGTTLVKKEFQPVDLGRPVEPADAYPPLRSRSAA